MKTLRMLPLALVALMAGGATRIVQDQCGPFTDVTPGFCPYVLELYYLGITAGTSATTFSPDDPLTRGQGAVFIAKGLNQSLARSSPRAALGQWWTTTPHWDLDLGTTFLGLDSAPYGVASDDADVWVAVRPDSVARIRASDGKLLETWTGMHNALVPLVALGRVLVLTGGIDFGSLYIIDPSQPPDSATLAVDIGNGAQAIAFDGTQIFTTSGGGIQHDPYLSIITPGPTLPWSIQHIRNADHVMAGRLIFDGTSMWLCDADGDLLRLDSTGAIVQVIPLGTTIRGGVFDGANLWLDSNAGIQIVRASDGVVVTTLPAGFPAAFDGARILVLQTGSVAVYRAADLALIGTFSTPDPFGPAQACSDGINFWLSLPSIDRLARF